MSKEEYSNQTFGTMTHIDSAQIGELMQQKRITIRGKGEKESRKETYDAIFTFNDSIICSEQEIPLRGGYFLTDNGQAEVTQLVGRFNTITERELWVTQAFEVKNADST